MNRRIFMTLSAVGFTLAQSIAGFAADTDVILTVNDMRSGVTTEFTDADLLALPQQSFVTTTIWTESKPKKFSGPALKTILDAVGSEPGNLRLHAINDYNALFPISRMEDSVPILAMRIDDAAFSVREKGPLWIMFPFDSESRYQSEEYFTLSVWQLKQIDILAE
ncbi:oxidoreductase [Roseovarius sp.]|uniref:oxidoreductase n=1 Tax=Roseovarius sp. TaxID=1486281 RepID=UPI003A9739E4